MPSNRDRVGVSVGEGIAGGAQTRFQGVRTGIAYFCTGVGRT